MLLRRIVSVSALAAGLITIPTVASQAAPSGGCPYPPHRPVIVIDDAPHTVTAGAPSSVTGQFKQNNCGIHNGQIKLQRRSLVNGNPSGSWSTFAIRTTDSHGLFAASTAPLRSEQVRAVFNASGSYPTTISSAIALNVRTAVSENVTILSGCRIRLVGRTIPAKTHRTLYVQGRASAGKFAGWTNLWRTSTDGKGNYSTTRTLTCGRTYNLSIYISHDSTNVANRSRTIFGIKPKH